MKKTTVINLFGGPGIGKSTISLGLSYYLKDNKYSVELVREQVKKKAWKGDKIGPYDELSILGVQSQEEIILYGKVDLIVTDAPLYLSDIYEQVYKSQCRLCQGAIFEFYRQAREGNVNHINFLLTREHEYVTEGRYETEEQAIAIDEIIEKYLYKHDLPYFKIKGTNKEKIQSIVNIINNL